MYGLQIGPDAGPRGDPPVWFGKDLPTLYAAMATIPVPWARDARGPALAALTAALYDAHRIEVPFTSYDDRAWDRIAAQLYNAPADYTRLADVLRTWRG
jgi:hypothetical protein